VTVTFSCFSCLVTGILTSPIHSSIPSQRGDRPANQTVANNYQLAIVSGRRNTVQCLHCHRQMIKEASRQQSHLKQCNTYQTRVINRSSPYASARIPSTSIWIASSTVRCLWSFLYMVEGPTFRLINLCELATIKINHPCVLNLRQKACIKYTLSSSKESSQKPCFKHVRTLAGRLDRSSAGFVLAAETSDRGLRQGLHREQYDNCLIRGKATRKRRMMMKDR